MLQSGTCRNATDESIADSPRAIAASYAAATAGMTTSGQPCSAAASTISRTSFRAMLTVNEAVSNGPSATFALPERLALATGIGHSALLVELGCRAERPCGDQAERSRRSNQAEARLKAIARAAEPAA